MKKETLEKIVNAKPGQRIPFNSEEEKQSIIEYIDNLPLRINDPMIRFCEGYR